MAVLHPLAHRDGVVPALRALADGPGDSALRLEGEGVRVRLRFGDRTLRVSIDSDAPCEGPVVRVPGALEQGLFAGLEFLGRGERSSSRLDVDTEEHLRFAPDPLRVTLPLMAAVTERGGIGVSWDDMELQPTFACPDFVDGTAGHRMSLRGRRIDAHVRAGA